MRNELFIGQQINNINRKRVSLNAQRYKLISSLFFALQERIR